MAEMKKLPFKNPWIANYPSTSQALSILNNYPELDEWILSRFIQLVCTDDTKTIDFVDFSLEQCPFLRYTEMKVNIIHEIGISMLDFVIHAIDQNYYVKAHIETSKLPIYDFHDRYHDLMIYGYDKKERIFYIADHFKGGYYTSSSCGFEELIQSIQYNKDEYFTHRLQLIEFDKSLTKYKILIQNDHKFLYKLDFHYIIHLIECYLNSTPLYKENSIFPFMTEYEAKSHKWGIQCYEILLYHVSHLEMYGSTDSFAIQSFYTVLAHKLMMQRRLSLCMERYPKCVNEMMCEKSIEISNRTKLVLNLFLLLQQKTRDMNRMNRLRSYIISLADMDRSLMENIFTTLKTNS